MASSLLMFTQSCTVAQKGIITSTTATTSNGYSVMNPGESIIIYKYNHPAHSPKEAEKYATKYFFTTQTTDVLKELTKGNLKTAFSTNHTFHDALDANFNQDTELRNYDDFHKMYKLNWLLKNSSK